MYSIILESNQDEKFIFHVGSDKFELSRVDIDKIKNSHLFWKTFYIFAKVLKIEINLINLQKITSTNLFFQYLPLILEHKDKTEFSVIEKFELLVEFYNLIWLDFDWVEEKVQDSKNQKFNQFCKNITNKN